MKILHRYLVFEYIQTFLLCAFFFTFLNCSIDVVEDLDDILKANASFSASLRFFALQVPVHLHEIFAFITLIALLISVGNMSRRNEVLIMLTSGISRLKIFAPILGLLLMLFAFDVYLGESIIPRINKEVKSIWNSDIKKKKNYEQNISKNVWVKGRGNRFYNINTYHSAQRQMDQAIVFTVNDENTSLTERIDAVQANQVMDSSNWVFNNGVHWIFDDHGKVLESEAFKEKEFELDQELNVFIDIARNPDFMNLPSLYRFISSLKKADRIVPPGYIFMLHKKIAMPLAVFVLCFAAFPIVLMCNKRGYFATLSFGLFYALGYYALMSTMELDVMLHLLPPAICAWFANVVFMSVGVYNFKRVFL